MRLRPISRDVRGSTEVNRDLLYEPDEHLKRDGEFPPMRGLRGGLGANTELRSREAVADRSGQSGDNATGLR